MRILLYTQQGVLGGSLRLLLNLAHHLASQHRVCVAFPRGLSGELLLPEFPNIAVADCNDATLNTATHGVLVCHLHRSAEPVAQLKAARKLAVSMEIASLYPPIVTATKLALFDGFLHLHPEQAAHFSDSQRRAKCHLLPLINNITELPPFGRSGAIGCVGSLGKHEANSVLEVLARTRQRRMLVWGEGGINFPPELSWCKRWRAHRYRRAGRLREMGLNADIRAVLNRFDLLLHTPRHSNGTSTVISDALASGKNVLLSPLPAHRQAYSHLPGVYFLDQRGLDIEEIMSAYDRLQFEQIRAAYAATYNRQQALAQWQRVIEG